MKKLLTRLAREQGGNTLLFIMVLLLVGMLVIPSSVDLMNTGLKAAGATDERTHELYAADAGVENVVNLVTGNPFYLPSHVIPIVYVPALADPALSINGSDVRASIEITDNSDVFKVTSVATSPDGKTTTIVAYVCKAPGLFDNALMALDGDIDLSNGLWNPITSDPAHQGNLLANNGCINGPNSGEPVHIDGWAVANGENPVGKIDGMISDYYGPAGLKPNGTVVDFQPLIDAFDANVIVPAYDIARNVATPADFAANQANPWAILSPPYTFAGNNKTLGNCTISAVKGYVSSVAVTAGGTGYTSAPVVGISGGAGAGATATATIAGGRVTSVTITNAGGNYTSRPSVTFTGGGGSGAAATAEVNSVDIGGTLIVGGVLTQNGNLNQNFNGPVWVQGTGLSKLNAGSPPNAINYVTNFNNIVYIAGDLEIDAASNRTINFNGNVYIDGYFRMQGAGTVNFNGNLFVNGTHLVNSRVMDLAAGGILNFGGAVYANDGPGRNGHGNFAIYAPGGFSITGYGPIVAKNDIIIGGNGMTTLEHMPVVISKLGDITSTGSEDFSAYIYAPLGKATLSGSAGYFYGGVTAKEIKITALSVRIKWAQLPVLGQGSGGLSIINWNINLG